MEIDPVYADVALRRFWNFTKVQPRLLSDGGTSSFIDVERDRCIKKPLAEPAA
jgi:hypothetical protein